MSHLFSLWTSFNGMGSYHLWWSPADILNLFWLGFWLDAEWLRWVKKKTLSPNRCSNSSGPLGNSLCTIINELIGLRLAQKCLWLLHYFAYISTFPWWHHWSLFKIWAITVPKNYKNQKIKKLSRYYHSFSADVSICS